MTVQLPKAPAAYDQGDQADLRAGIMQADAATRKSAENIDLRGTRLFIYDTATKARFQVVVTNGVLGIVPA